LDWNPGTRSTAAASAFQNRQSKIGNRKCPAPQGETIMIQPAPWVQREDRMITVMDSPLTVVITVQGALTYLAWLQREARRLDLKGVDTKIVSTRDGLIALYRLDE
jgi:hypothetical protein